MSEQSRLCRCGHAMTKEYAEGGFGSYYKYGYSHDPWAVEFWRCDACGRTLTAVFSNAVDAGKRKGETWYCHDEEGRWLHDLEGSTLTQVKGRGTVAVVADRFPSDFKLGERVDVASRRFVITGVEGASTMMSPPSEIKGVSLVLREER